jgi:hypothetical protein
MKDPLNLAVGVLSALRIKASWIYFLAALEVLK